MAAVAVAADADASVLRASVCDCLLVSLFCAYLWHDYLRHGNQLTDGFPFFPRFRRLLPRESILGLSASNPWSKRLVPPAVCHSGCFLHLWVEQGCCFVCCSLLLFCVLLFAIVATFQKSPFLASLVRDRCSIFCAWRDALT